jgi:tRNA-dihydrouridine synthase
MIARGSLGNPWIFGELTGRRTGPPAVVEILHELRLMIEGAEEHFGVERAGRWLRKVYPWYAERLGFPRKVQAEWSTTPTTAAMRDRLDGLEQASSPLAAAAAA